MFPVGRLEACLLLPLLVPLLHLTLAHPAWGQKEGVITTRYGSCRQRGRESGPGEAGGQRGSVQLTAEQRTSPVFQFCNTCSPVFSDMERPG